MFQLMPDTAKQYGLSLFPRDQRFQTEPSATASAQYLKHLYGRFQDWRLALAAYNAGEGAVQKHWTATNCEVTTTSQGISPQKHKCMCRGSKPSSCSVKARSCNSSPRRSEGGNMEEERLWKQLASLSAFDPRKESRARYPQ